MSGASPPAGQARIDADLREYYAQRASSYEAFYAKPERQADIRAIEAWLAERFAGRRVLEIACGTGWWTVHGARHASRWIASDVNEAVLAIARAKPLAAGSGAVDFRIADAYRLDGFEDDRLDAAFAGHWWSHVPLARLASWIETLHARLPAGARIVMLDNAYVPGSSTPISRRDAAGDTWQARPMPDGGTREVLKNFPDRDAVLAAIGPRAVAPRWRSWPHYWAIDYELGAAQAPAAPAAHE